MRERWSADRLWTEGSQELEQPITTLKICWKEFQEVGPPQWGRGGGEANVCRVVERNEISSERA